ncbi:Alpha/Beta hydrolase protein [Leptodontidium sp. 2 PMI_412]|nr:Alpha/Beta hydrolase protein [Leptodontidium sp. MPI-SDFR-AT-0119]KAH9212857.1 Alpha/Beta hydrolase protein [Leptodontidium sp. 2 PMI_412]
MASNEPVEEEKVIVQEDFSYGDHELQKLTVYHHFGKNFQQERGLYIIYIHGGAWRDPTITDKAFLPTIRHLFSHPSNQDLINDHITAFASISYRLSVHPSHPQEPGTPATKLRDAKHPDHLHDVVSAISFLQAKYGFGSRYLLIGHSCGATLAFQSIIRQQLSIPPSIPFKNPEIVVGVAGIYDMRLLRDKNSHPAYQEFLVSAFGEDEKAWDLASPANYEFLASWPEVKTAVVVSSTGDELVDPTQIECMARRLENLRDRATVKVLKGFLHQTHDHIWDEGVGLADVIVETLKAWVEDGGSA